MPRRSGTGAGRQQFEALVKVLHKLGRAEAAHPGGGQLDRQRQPVQPLAQRRHGRGDGVGEREAGRHGRRTVDKQAHRIVRPGVGSPAGVQLGGHGQRLHLVADLAGHAERFAAGGEHPQRSAGGQQAGDDLGRFGDHVLAVVHYQQAARLACHLTQDVAQRASRLRYHTQGPRQRVTDHVRRDWRQIGEPDAVRERVGVDRGDVQREPGLAHPAGTGERDQAMGINQRGELARLALPADQAGQRHREQGVSGSRPAELRAHLGQRRPVGDAELAQQRSDVALHRPHGHVEPTGDLAVTQPLRHRQEHLGLAFGDAGASQPPGHTVLAACHGAIVLQDQRSAVRRRHQYQDP